MASIRTLQILTTLLMIISLMMSSTRAVAEVDCSSLILNMADCLSFVTSGSTVEKPEGTCCSGLKTVVRTGPKCLCDAFKNSASLGVTLDLTKAASLPSVCKVAAPPSARCGLSVPVSSPAPSPVAGVAAPELSTGGDIGTPVPALGPGLLSASDASVVSVSIFSVFFFIIFCFCF